MASKMDATVPIIPNYSLSKKHQLMIEEASGDCWYVRQYLKMSLIENRLAGKKLRKHNRSNLKDI